MRLIDADELKAGLYKQWFMDILLTQRNSEDMFYALAQKIDEQPTAYDADVVVERLKMKIDNAEFDELLTSNEKDAYVDACRRAIEIVKAGGINE